MDDTNKLKLMRATGWLFISVGAILVYKGTPPSYIMEYGEDVIDAVFEVLED